MLLSACMTTQWRETQNNMPYSASDSDVFLRLTELCFVQLMKRWLLDFFDFACPYWTPVKRYNIGIPGKFQDQKFKIPFLL